MLEFLLILILFIAKISVFLLVMYIAISIIKLIFSLLYYVIKFLTRPIFLFVIAILLIGYTGYIGFNQNNIHYKILLLLIATFIIINFASVEKYKSKLTEENKKNPNSHLFNVFYSILFGFFLGTILDNIFYNEDANKVEMSVFDEVLEKYDIEEDDNSYSNDNFFDDDPIDFDDDDF